MTKRIIAVAAVVGMLTFAMGALGAQGAAEYVEAHPELATVANDVESVVASDEEGILWMREEEKLARDVYLALYEQWGIRTFANIARSEQRHMDAVAYLMQSKGIEDPVVGTTAGEFVNDELQALYDQLVEQGTSSPLEALTVGAIIEDLDISDLQQLLEETDDPDTVRVYTALLRGSENHMRSFAGLLERFGGSYEARYISSDELDAIMGR